MNKAKLPQKVIDLVAIWEEILKGKISNGEK